VTEISIHAPARGATLHTRGMGVTPRDIFQSTLPHGERRGDGATLFRQREISIHAPARGATDKVLT